MGLDIDRYCRVGDWLPQIKSLGIDDKKEIKQTKSKRRGLIILFDRVLTCAQAHVFLFVVGQNKD